MLHSAVQSPRFRIVAPRRRLEGSAQQPTAPLKPFVPVVPVKSVPIEFTISLENACFSDFSGQKAGHMPLWKPEHTIASWQSVTTDAESGRVKLGPSEPFTCIQPAVVTGEWSEPALPALPACELHVEWAGNSAANAKVKKRLRHKVGSNGFEDNCIGITCFAANAEKSKVFDYRSKPIVLGSSQFFHLAKFGINLSVKSRLPLKFPDIVLTIMSM